MTSNGGQSILEPIRRPDAHASAPGPPPARRGLSAGAGSPLPGARLWGPKKAWGSLERDGLVAARSLGRTRVFRIEPRYFAFDALQRFLERLGGAGAGPR